jgi:hypothetical protein
MGLRFATSALAPVRRPRRGMPIDKSHTRTTDTPRRSRTPNSFHLRTGAGTGTQETLNASYHCVF